MQFGRIEVGQSDLNPGARIGGRSDAEAVAIADVAHGPGEGLTRTRRQRGRAGVCSRWARQSSPGDKGRADERFAPAHAACFIGLKLGFLASMARANLSQRAIPARFSGM